MLSAGTIGDPLVLNAKSRFRNLNSNYNELQQSSSTTAHYRKRSKPRPQSVATLSSSNVSSNSIQRTRTSITSQHRTKSPGKHLLHQPQSHPPVPNQQQEEYFNSPPFYLSNSPRSANMNSNIHRHPQTTPTADDSFRTGTVEGAATTSTAPSNRKVPPYLSRDFHPCDWPLESDCFGTLGSNPNVNYQEQQLLRDLLYILIGIEGKYIRLKRSEETSRYKLALDPTTDRHLVVTTDQILRVSYCYSAIVTYIESKVYGLVNQALVAAIHRHLHEYNMLVARMEEMLMNNDLFLQKMFYLLLPYISTFNLLRDLASKLYKNKCFGGGVLTVLHEKTKSIQGMDNKALELCLTLTKSASIPYFDILKTWIYYGEINDPRREFFIEDTQHSTSANGVGGMSPGNSALAQNSASTNVNNGENVNKNSKSNKAMIAQNIDSDDDEYDDDFGKFNDSKAPPPAPILGMISHNAHSSHQLAPSEFTSASKYSLNDLLRGVANIQMGMTTAPPSMVPEAISLLSSSSASSSNSALSGTSTGPVIFTPKPEEILYSFDDATYLAPIMSAYEEASSQLLHILINESQLVETFNAVKHYMLLSMGDYIVHFMKFASKDLCKRTDSVVQHRLDSMMGMALGISVAANDRGFLKDDPHVEFTGKSFLKQIVKIMKPLDGTVADDHSPSSSYLLKNELDDDDDDDDEDSDDVGLNRSIISDVIEGKDDGRWALSTSGNFIPGMSISSQVRLRKQLYINSGKVPKIQDLTDGLGASKVMKNNGTVPTGHNKNKLYCYESLMLKFDVPFPLSLIFTQKSIVCYQLMFRYVFLCRYAEMELEETWKDNILNVQLRQADQLARKAVSANISSTGPEESEGTVRHLVKAFKSMHKKAFALRYKMIAFVRNFHYFYAFEVIDPFFAQFISQLTKRGSSLDSVIECHEKFLEHCFSSCFLTSLEITSIIIKIFMLCIELSHALKDSIDPDDHSSMMESSCFFSRSAGDPNPYSAGLKSRDSVEDQLGSNSLGSMARSSPGAHFESQLHEKLNRIYFANRHFGKSIRTVKEIVERANTEFDALVTKLLKKIYSDNCEYHMMYPFVARLDFNDFYRSKIIE
ncbi:hypothetical protein RDWZM_000941 [Blomia tropicalis]|uniref:Gamma-tubulin complex component n=1 Tax=Blomia tropicalis TaxID=40697 RepID=A0A9Q0RQ55_BLOTA|nr:hypothetical protein RDWZM_000941 [Blomia tropicalis]